MVRRGTFVGSSYDHEEKCVLLFLLIFELRYMDAIVKLQFSLFSKSKVWGEWWGSVQAGCEGRCSFHGSILYHLFTRSTFIT